MKKVSIIKLLAPQNDLITQPLQKWTWRREDQLASTSEAINWSNLKAVSEDRGHPQAVPFAWESNMPLRSSLCYELTISQSSNFENPLILRNLSEPKTKVRYLYIATRYFWKVAAICSGRRVAVSPVWSFITNSTPPRWITVPGITNVRDMGGWPLPGNRMVRQGVIYRGSEMNDHVEITEDGKEIFIRKLGIHTDLDLRAESASRVLDEQAVQWINIPIAPYEHICEETYKKRYCQIFEIFADASNYPIFFHCWGGADRGGSLAFLLGALLGMSMNDLIQDYELTSLSIWGVRSRESDEFKKLLGALDEFGSDKDTINEKVERYLRDAGLSETHIAQIREQCVVSALADSKD